MKEKKWKMSTVRDSQPSNPRRKAVRLAILIFLRLCSDGLRHQTGQMITAFSSSGACREH